MSEKFKPSKVPLGIKLKFYVDRLRMPKVQAEFELVNRLVSRMRKEIDDRTINLKFNVGRTDNAVLASIQGLLSKDPEEVLSEGRKRMARERAVLDRRIWILEGLMEIRYRYLSVFEGQAVPDSIPDLEEALGRLDGILLEESAESQPENPVAVNRQRMGATQGMRIGVSRSRSDKEYLN